MKGYPKLSVFLGGCFLQLAPLFLHGQIYPSGPIGPVPARIDPRRPVFFSPPPISPSFPPPNLSPPSAPPLPDNTIQPEVTKVPSETDRMSDVLNFWFGFLPGPDFFPEDKMAIWFASTPEIDRQIRENFSQDVLNAERGNYNYWRETARGRLALILLLDQFPRHIYRNRHQAFMLDRMARALVLEGMQKGEDKDLYPIERAFFYLPLEHSEDLQVQNLSVASYRQLVAESPEIIQPQMRDFLQSAMIHQQQIARFHRFPHRNAILGRESTPEEALFLMQWRRR